MSFTLPVLQSVSYEIKKLFSTFSVVKNDLVLEDIKKSRTKVGNTMLIVLVQIFCSLYTRIPGGFCLSNIHFLNLFQGAASQHSLKERKYTRS